MTAVLFSQWIGLHHRIEHAGWQRTSFMRRIRWRHWPTVRHARGAEPLPLQPATCFGFGVNFKQGSRRTDVAWLHALRQELLTASRSTSILKESLPLSERDFIAGMRVRC